MKIGRKKPNCSIKKFPKVGGKGICKKPNWGRYPNVMATALYFNRKHKKLIGEDGTRPSGGWTGDADCLNPSNILVTIKFSGNVYFPDNSATSVVITNTTTAEVATGIQHTAGTTSPANTIVYDVTWVTPPEPGDLILFEYTGTFYTDVDLVPIPASTISIVNCSSMIWCFPELTTFPELNRYPCSGA